MKQSLWCCVGVVALLLVAGLGALAAPCTITVQPGESIQAAIDAASPGDVICLAQGVWRERLTITKSLTLRGQGQGRTTIVSGQRPTIHAHQASGALILSMEGISIQDTSLAFGYLPNNAMLHIEGSVQATISECDISGRTGGFGIGLTGSAKAVITNCTMSGVSYGVGALDNTQAMIAGTAFPLRPLGEVFVMNTAEVTVMGSGSLGVDYRITGLGPITLWADASVCPNLERGVVDGIRAMLSYLEEELDAPLRLLAIPPLQFPFGYFIFSDNDIRIDVYARIYGVPPTQAVRALEDTWGVASAAQAWQRLDDERLHADAERWYRHVGRTTAHEVFHLWQFQQFPSFADVPAWITEGTAEHAAWMAGMRYGIGDGIAALEICGAHCGAYFEPVWPPEAQLDLGHELHTGAEWRAASPLYYPLFAMYFLWLHEDVGCPKSTSTLYEELKAGSSWQNAFSRTFGTRSPLYIHDPSFQAFFESFFGLR